MKLKFLILLLLAASSSSQVALAQSIDQKSTSEPMLTQGEVRKVDMDAKKITIRHGPIQNLQMPAMTMVFQVKDHSLLSALKEGDKVKFSVEKDGNIFIVTGIEREK